MRRRRRAKIIATLGPSSTAYEDVKALFEAGADVFRLNFSHGERKEHEERYRIVRRLEDEFCRPIGVLQDVQGPKLRVGAFMDSKIFLNPGQKFRLDSNRELGDAHRVNLPHPEIFAALKNDADVLIDDGKVRLKVIASGSDFVETVVVTGGELSDRKGVNVPGVVLPIGALTEKDVSDIEFGLALGVDWIGLSFVQRPEDIIAAREIVGDKAKLIAKIEKPMAVLHLDRIVDLADGVMVARGDLGVETPAEDVPAIQRRIVRKCRELGKPVIIATQMLDSMVRSPTPTRAEASDVATAIYDGADAVMLSAESASGNYPKESVAMMDRIIKSTERDPFYAKAMDESRAPPTPSLADAITVAAKVAAKTIGGDLMVTLTQSGGTAFHAARERPHCHILALTPVARTARQLTLVWGVHPASIENATSFERAFEVAAAYAKREDFAKEGDYMVITSGTPCGRAGTTDTLRVFRV